MPVTLQYIANMTGLETFEGDSLGTSNATIKHTGMNTTKVIKADTTVPATKMAAFEKQLSGGVANIDLTALVGTNGGAVDGTGLKVQAAKFIADATNTEVVSIGEGASNGYELLGDSWTMDLAAGQEVMLFGNDAAPDIGALAKVIDLASSDEDAKVDVSIVMG